MLSCGRAVEVEHRRMTTVRTSKTNSIFYCKEHGCCKEQRRLPHCLHREDKDKMLNKKRATKKERETETETEMEKVLNTLEENIASGFGERSSRVTFSLTGMSVNPGIL